MKAAFQGEAKRIRDLLQNGEAAPTTLATAFYATPSAEWDHWLDLVWDIDGVPEDGAELPRGCVPYIPCPASTVHEALQQAAVTRDDVFVDVGSGAGRVAFLAHLLTGSASIGLEIQSDLVRAAQGRANWLNLTRLRFVHGDAAALVRFVPLGTVFFLYCPFGVARLRELLRGLEDIARTKQIRVCCVDMPPLTCSWLVRHPSSSSQVDVYRSTLHRQTAG